MQYTENLDLPLFETADAVDLFTTYNAAMETLDEAVEEKATSADVDAVEQIANAAGATATQAQADATAAGTAAASAGTVAAAAQADATQALSDAAAASTTAAGAATTAAAAEALAQQAIAAGMKLKQLSTAEVVDVLALDNTYNSGILSYTSASYQFGYVINFTPRIKLVFAEEILTDSSVGSTSNKEMTVRSLTQSGNKPTVPLATEINIIPSQGTLQLRRNSYGAIIVETVVSPLPSFRGTFAVSICGIVTYDHDIDLGTDITQ